MVEIWLSFAVLGAALILLAIGYFVGLIITKQRINYYWESHLPELRREAIARSRANLGGKFSENLCMYFPNFPFSPTEMRWLGGSPTDYLVFKGMDNNDIKEIIFLEIKSGKSQLSPREKQIKDAVEKKNVSWKLYRVPARITQVAYGCN